MKLRCCVSTAAAVVAVTTAINSSHRSAPPPPPEDSPIITLPAPAKTEPPPPVLTVDRRLSKQTITFRQPTGHEVLIITAEGDIRFKGTVAHDAEDVRRMLTAFLYGAGCGAGPANGGAVK